MSYTKDREDFLLAMQGEGVPADVARAVLRDAATVQRCAELACSSESAYNDRVRCPAVRPGRACLCDDEGTFDAETGEHGDVPRYAVRSAQREGSIVRALKPYSIVPVFGGDPRGACVKLKVPSGRTDDWGQTGLCVPVRG